MPKLIDDAIGPIGSTISSMLTEAQFQALHGSGWVLADGRSAVGSRYAAITSATIVPDLRGLVIRGKDNGRGANPDGDLTLGSYQADALQGHTHNPSPNYIAFNTTGPYSIPGGGNIGVFNGSTDPLTDGPNGAPRYGLETRMKNLTANYFFRIN